jgi:hypothetical protein
MAGENPIEKSCPEEPQGGAGRFEIASKRSAILIRIADGESSKTVLCGFGVEAFSIIDSHTSRPETFHGVPPGDEYPPSPWNRLSPVFLFLVLCRFLFDLQAPG